MRVLLVEDDARLGAALSDVLRVHGMEVEHVTTARMALARLNAQTEAVVLDLGLPDRDGFEVCSRIRRTHDVPILIATARSDLTARVHGLNLGADDYLVKPYDVRELLARLHAIARRHRREPAALGPGIAESVADEPELRTTPTTDDAQPVEELPPLSAEEVVIDVSSRTVIKGGKSIPLTRKEFDLLALLARHPGVVFRREQIISEVWQSTWDGLGRTLEVHVAAVRSKTKSPGLIETVRGVGYRLAIGAASSTWS
ncbi:response regulator transcription factor [Kineosporia sp. NBRC 101731]|uniref:response regulator transcription factor n=1 Tax=Kineosporia sp. NBRC 101731 TaxID=3032199 RepID=UPI0024A3555E|nr:response regulator transcription factor [Kineosporia sp. NBRC 101731]GLY30286.1 DNA-binding response regulator [Kineosporia sp. NBRC 101731]